jgi:hypothetical protein
MGSMKVSRRLALPKSVDAETVARNNLNVDVRQIRQAQELLDELRRQGLAKPQYNLGPPYVSNRAHGPKSGE